MTPPSPTNTMSGPLFTRTNASQRLFAVKGTGYLREVAGRVAPPAVPRRRHPDPQAVTHEPVADVLSRIFGNVSQILSHTPRFLN